MPLWAEFCPLFHRIPLTWGGLTVAKVRLWMHACNTGAVSLWKCLSSSRPIQSPPSRKWGWAVAAWFSWLSSFSSLKCLLTLSLWVNTLSLWVNTLSLWVNTLSLWVNTIATSALLCLLQSILKPFKSLETCLVASRALLMMNFYCSEKHDKTNLRDEFFLFWEHGQNKSFRLWLAYNATSNIRTRTSSSEQVRQEHEHDHQNNLVSTHVYRGGGPNHKEDMPRLAIWKWKHTKYWWTSSSDDDDFWLFWGQCCSERHRAVPLFCVVKWQ